MSNTIPPAKSAAVLVWMPEDQSPSAAAFDPNNIQTPPVPNPEAWWYFGEAVNHAMELVMPGLNHRKRPSIKFGEALFDPQI